VFAGIATAVILLMFPMFAKVKPTALFYLLFAVYNAVLVAGFLGHVPLHYVDWAYASTTALVIASRGSQILAIFGNRATGALSFLTTFLQFAGTAARTWTLINGGRSVADWAVVAIACGLNGIILLSFAVFPSKKKAKGKRE
jgi:mannose-P-dolichol utilization defect protein 1